MSSGLFGLLTAPDLHGLFSLVCGQNEDHTWMTGGEPLPCCERCLGLYAGAAFAFFLHLWVRPKLTGRFLELHGAFLLLMVPLGFHWVAQGPVMRTVSGVLFGAGIVTFLWLPLARPERGHVGGSGSDPQQSPNHAQAAPGRQLVGGFSAEWAYPLGLVLCATFLPTIASSGGRIAALVLSLAAVGGLASLALLLAGDLVVGIRKWSGRRVAAAPPSARAREVRL